MENVHALLGVRDSASLEDIEEAYRNKKQLYNPDRFRKGSPEWEFACVRSEVLDKAYAEAVSAHLVPRRSASVFGRSIRAFADGNSRESDRAASEFGGLAALLAISPVAACLMQLLIPAILFDLAPGGLRMSSLFPVALVVVLSYAFPLFLRFAVLRRPLESASATLALFPATLITTDFFASALLYFSFLLPGHDFRYIPTFYVTGWGPLFLILCAHCAILRVSRDGCWKFVPPFRRLVSHTLVLCLSLALSLFTCAHGNREKTIAVAAAVSSAAVSPIEGVPGEPWRRLELFDAGMMEIPDSWYVEDSNGPDRRVEHGQVVQHIREALLARPYGQKERGPDFAFEVIVYRWTRRNGQLLPLPEDALSRLQEQQFEALQRDYVDVVSPDWAQGEGEGYSIRSMTVETRSVPGYVVRFKNMAFERDGRLYALTVGYPAEEESAWGLMLDEILRRWNTP